MKNPKISKEDLSDSNRRQSLLVIGFFIVFAFILYGNTIQNNYSLDDDYVTFNDPTVRKGIKAIP